ncbi:protoporphyrinogen oxidase [Flammeovirga kamogawensis]|uniref:Coproporphyrinogen III oxidase n=1 Tax=Flammeovirga kamogawensis TaxID=373891 RepID=A0ABX8GXC6_9BACT|nr:protoporphyrinogen oxidase [Flammeovirga kamogawensis]MBB6460616.1 oxygen-dependent protoporphyrinogen oxidase [Flammeovirga kamogawensis]QWG07971.1 protoporphyrinogen oxidase [Flammeovirga kamogawensis]TRX69779.1 protoporphyrinogen oxidase [Flammeovirga kamogawensis]
MRIGIIGGGISGLTTAFLLKEKGFDCVVLEAAQTLGGCIKTDTINDRIYENGPNSLLLTESHLDLINRLGITDELLEAEDVNKDRYILRDGKYRILPSGPQNFFSNSFFSWSSKFKIMTEFWRKNKPTSENESLYDFINRRFNQEICDYALDPFVSGIYAGDAKKLAVKAAFPALYEAEKEYGSIIKGMIKSSKKNKEEGAPTQRKKAFSFKKGLTTFIEGLASQVEVKLNTKVLDIKKNENQFEILTENETLVFDKIIVTSSAHTTAKFIKNLMPSISIQLNNLYAPPMCIVHSVYKKDDVERPIGFGGLNPYLEKTFTSGSIWSSCIFPNRAGKDEVLITSFVGGVQRAKNTSLSDEEIKDNVKNELAKTLNFKEEPVFQKTYKWEKAIPQYSAEILKLWDDLKSNAIPNLYFNANWKGGISVPNCIDNSIKLVDSLDK